MDVSKINGVITIKNGKLDLGCLLDDGIEMSSEINKFIAIKMIIDSAYFNYEKEYQIKNKDVKNSTFFILSSNEERLISALFCSIKAGRSFTLIVYNPLTEPA